MLLSDGGTFATERSRALNEFNSESSEHFLFLLSTKAGGLGLNLQARATQRNAYPVRLRME